MSLHVPVGTSLLHRSDQNRRCCRKSLFLVKSTIELSFRFVVSPYFPSPTRNLTEWERDVGCPSTSKF